MEAAGYRGKYLYCKKSESFTVGLMRMLGVSPDRFVSSDQLEWGKVYVFERLYSIHHDALGPMECHPEVLSEMGAVIRGQLKRDERYPGKVYVKRIGIRKLCRRPAGPGTTKKSTCTQIIRWMKTTFRD